MKILYNHKTLVNSLAEFELLDKLRNGDEAAFDHFYHGYSPPIYRKLLKMVKVEIVAQELLQDVFVKIWEKRQLIDTSLSFRSYLFRIAENSVFDFYRKLGREDRLQREVNEKMQEGYTHIEEDFISKETKEHLKEAIDQLTSKQKQVFILCKLEDKTYDEVGKIMGISTSTVNGHIVNATKSIQNYLSKQEVPLLYILILTEFLW